MTSPLAPPQTSQAVGWWAVLTPIQATGIPSAEAFGTAVIRRLQQISPIGISSAEAFGIPRISWPQTVTLPGIPSGEAFGTLRLDQSIGGAGIPSAEGFGNATVSRGGVSVATTGIASGEAFGAATLTRGAVTISPTGIPSAEAFGAPGTNRGITVLGIASAESFGTGVIGVGAVIVSAVGIASLETFGTPNLTGAQPISPTALPSAEAFGVPRVSMNISAPSIASAEAFGSPVLTGIAVISEIGIPSSEAFGVPVVGRGTVNLTATGIASTEAFGVPAITVGIVYVNPTGIASAEAFGTATVLRGGVTVTTVGIPSAEAFGTDTVTTAPPQAITGLTGIVSAEAFGTPIFWDGYDKFTDIANGSAPTTAETGQTWSYFASGVASIPEVQSGYMDAPRTVSGSPSGNTAYPELDMGTKISKMGATVRINTLAGARTGTGWGIGIITWADGGLHANWPTIPRTSGHIVFTASQVIYYGITSLGGAFAASQTWNHGATIPDNTDFYVEIEFLYGTTQMVVKIIIGGTTYTTTWTDAKIVGYTGENWACYQSYYGGSASNKRVEFKETFVQRLSPKGVTAVGIPSGEAFGTPYVNQKIIAPTGIASTEAFGTFVLTGGVSGINYTDTATGADNGQPSASPGADWTQVTVPAAGWGIRRINNEWGIEYGNIWNTAKNNVGIPNTTKYETGFKINVAGGLWRVYVSQRVYAEFNGSGCAFYTCTSDYASTAGGALGTTSTTTFAATDIFSVFRNGNVYTVYKNGVATACTWTDSGGTYASYKQPGMGMYCAATTYRIDNFFAKDVP